jgi:hypothetical protein
LFFIASLVHFFSCELHFQFDNVIDLRMWLHLFQSCMQSHMHCRALSLFSWWSEQIDNVDFFDWDCDWFWRMIALTCSTIFNLFFAAFLYSRIVFSKWTFLNVARFCKIQLSQNMKAHFRFVVKNSLTNIVSESKKFLIFKLKMRFLKFSQFVIQISIWFLNDDCFNVWNFSCIYFFDLIVDFLVFCD